jgi:hypothetical protein
MAATGELIRLQNYVDDIVTTLRRISASIPMMETEERQRLAEKLRSTATHFSAVMEKLEKGAQ